MSIPRKELSKKIFNFSLRKISDKSESILLILLLGEFKEFHVRDKVEIFGTNAGRRYLIRSFVATIRMYLSKDKF